MNKTKYCIKCNEEKKVNKNNFRKLGCGFFSAQCKECDKKDEEIHKQMIREYKNEQQNKKYGF